MYDFGIVPNKSNRDRQTALTESESIHSFIPQFDPNAIAFTIINKTTTTKYICYSHPFSLYTYTCICSITVLFQLKLSEH